MASLRRLPLLHRQHCTWLPTEVPAPSPGTGGSSPSSLLLLPHAAALPTFLQPPATKAVVPAGAPGPSPGPAAFVDAKRRGQEDSVSLPREKEEHQSAAPVAVVPLLPVARRAPPAPYRPPGGGVRTGGAAAAAAFSLQDVSTAAPREGGGPMPSFLVAAGRTASGAAEPSSFVAPWAQTAAAQAFAAPGGASSPYCLPSPPPPQAVPGVTPVLSSPSPGRALLPAFLVAPPYLAPPPAVQGSGTAAGGGSAPPPAAAAAPPAAAARLVVVGAGEDDDDGCCVVCLEAQRTHALVPCGHISLCGPWCACHSAGVPASSIFCVVVATTSQSHFLPHASTAIF